MTEPVHLTTGMAPPAVPVQAPVDLSDVVVDMDAFRDQGMEALGAKGIRFRPGGPGTEIFTVPHPLLLDDDRNDAVKAAAGTVDIAKALLNTEADPNIYYRFKAAGGRAGDVLIAWRRLSEGLGAPK